MAWVHVLFLNVFGQVVSSYLNYNAHIVGLSELLAQSPNMTKS